jgi:hypothetical protein
MLPAPNQSELTRQDSGLNFVSFGSVQALLGGVYSIESVASGIKLQPERVTVDLLNASVPLDSSIQHCV